jgi:hypothetical protein
MEAWAQSSEREERAKAGIIGALIGELFLTFFTAWIEGLPLSGVPSWPDKLCNRVEVKRGEEYVTSEHVLYSPFLSGGIFGAGFGIWFHESTNIDSGRFTHVLIGSQIGMGVGMMVACQWVIPVFDGLADSTLRALLKNTGLFVRPALAAGTLGARFYKGAPKKENLYSARQSVSLSLHGNWQYGQELAEPR